MLTAKVLLNCCTTSAKTDFPLRGREVQDMFYTMIHLEVMYGIIQLGSFCSYLKSSDTKSAGKKLPDPHAVSLSPQWPAFGTSSSPCTLNQRGCFTYDLPRGKASTPFWLFRKDFVRITCKPFQMVTLKPKKQM